MPKQIPYYLVKNLISDTNILEDNAETFSIYFAESIRKQSQYEFFYLINFDVSVPILNDKNDELNLDNKEGKIFYTQEIFINNIDFEKYQKSIEQEKNKNNIFLQENDSEEENEEENENSQ